MTAANPLGHAPIKTLFFQYYGPAVISLLSSTIHQVINGIILGQQLHQIQSLYLDDQLRLYIVGSDAVCGSEVSFKFCNSKAGRGVVYVSKNSNP